MDMAARTNTANTVRLVFTDGDAYFETFRNTLGGWANLLDRVAARDGLTNGRTTTRTTVTDTTTTLTLANGRTCTVEYGWTKA